MFDRQGGVWAFKRARRRKAGCIVEFFTFCLWAHRGHRTGDRGTRMYCIGECFKFRGHEILKLLEGMDGYPISCKQVKARRSPARDAVIAGMGWFRASCEMPEGEPQPFHHGHKSLRHLIHTGLHISAHIGTIIKTKDDPAVERAGGSRLFRFVPASQAQVQPSRPIESDVCAVRCFRVKVWMGHDSGRSGHERLLTKASNLEASIIQVRARSCNDQCLLCILSILHAAVLALLDQT